MGLPIAATGTLTTTLGKHQPFRYRGYVYDAETGWYYLQTRYYDPSICRFISADVLLSTGQGVLGHNAYAYCLNNPVNMSDDTGCLSIPLHKSIIMNDGGGTPNNQWQEQLVRLYTKLYARYGDEYIGIDLEPWADVLYEAIKVLGMDAVTATMAEVVCCGYEEGRGAQFPLTNETVAYEIEYHIDGYMFSQGKMEYFWRRNITTWFFTKSKLELHCKRVDIYVKDLEDKIWEGGFWEALFFGYRRGLR